jgi:membrane protein DedA with SNARE-associated domain
VEEFLDQFGYIALSVGTFFEGEIAILIASSLIHTGFFEGHYTVLFGFAGSFISDWLYYLIGRFNGKYFIEKRPGLKAKVAPVQHFFEANQLQILLSYRFLYGFRVIIPLVIGMSAVKPRQFLFYTLISGLFWASTVSFVGYLVGRFLEIETAAFEENILFIVLGFGCFGLLMGYLIKRLAFRRILV